jgi:hypothetical protein
MKRSVSRGAFLLIVLTIWAMPAGAAQKGSKNRSKHARTPSATAPAAVGPECPPQYALGQAGLRAFIDPETGELREGTPEEQRALSSAVARAESAEVVESPEIVVHPDGFVVVDLKGNFMQSVVAVRNPDGSLSTRCAPASEKGHGKPKPAAAPALEER